MKEFNATLDSKTKRNSLLSLGMFALIFIYFYYISVKSNDYTSLWLFLTIAVLSFIVPLFFKPLKFVLTDSDLVIARLIGKITIPYSEIKKVEPIEGDDLRGTKRLFGSGGMYGYFGLFKNPNYGTMKFYTTRKDNLVYILTSEGKNIVISPDEREEFFEIINKYIGKKGQD